LAFFHSQSNNIQSASLVDAATISRLDGIIFWSPLRLFVEKKVFSARSRNERTGVPVSGYYLLSMRKPFVILEVVVKHGGRHKGFQGMSLEIIARMHLTLIY
jgi:hypothetical protein